MTSLFRVTEFSDQKERQIIVEPVRTGISTFYDDEISFSRKARYVHREVMMHIPKPNGRKLYFDYFQDPKFINFARNVKVFEFSMYLNGVQGFSSQRSFLIHKEGLPLFPQMFIKIYDFDITIIKYCQKITRDNKTYYIFEGYQKGGYFDVFTGKFLEKFNWKKEGF